MTPMDITIPQLKILTPSEENFLKAFMEALYKINPSLHKNLSHMRELVFLPGY